MRDFKNIENDIQKKLQKAEIKAPDFDALFNLTEIEEAVFYQKISDKLYASHIEAPDFDTLFKTTPLPITQKPNYRPQWLISACISAACIALALILPKLFVSEKVVPDTQASAIEAKTNQIEPIASVQKQAPMLAALIDTVSTVAPSATVQESMVDSTHNDLHFNKIEAEVTPTKIREKTSENTKSLSNQIEFKQRTKKEKRSLGLNLNGANRLLSLLNSKDNSEFILSSVTRDHVDGYNQLEGAYLPQLRSAGASKNEWIAADNLTSAMLQNVETNYSLPINIGLTTSFPIMNGIDFITGLQYTYLANHIRGNQFNLKQELHYLGIPVKLNFNVLKRSQFTAYLSAGGTLEKALAAIQKSTVDGQGTWDGSQSIKGIAASVVGNAGLSYEIKNDFMLYVEPGVSYYFPTDQPISYRTEEPLSFSLSLGVRYRFQ